MRSLQPGQGEESKVSESFEKRVVDNMPENIKKLFATRRFEDNMMSDRDLDEEEDREMKNYIAQNAEDYEDMMRRQFIEDENKFDQEMMEHAIKFD